MKHLDRIYGYATTGAPDPNAPKATWCGLTVPARESIWPDVVTAEEVCTLCRQLMVTVQGSVKLDYERIEQIVEKALAEKLPPTPENYYENKPVLQPVKKKWWEF